MLISAAFRLDNKFSSDISKGMAIDLGSLEQAVLSLKEALETYDIQSASSPPTVNLVLRDGVIQRFEYTVELCWKMLKRHLEEKGLERVDSFGIKELFRAGYEQGLVADPVVWLDYLKKRNLTSHTYDEETAKIVFAVARSFLPDAENLLLRLKEKNQ